MKGPKAGAVRSGEQWQGQGGLASPHAAAGEPRAGKSRPFPKYQDSCTESRTGQK